MIKKNQLQRNIKWLQGNIDAIDPGICKRFPMSAYIHDVKSYPEIRMHGYFRPRRKKIFSEIQKHYGFHAMALYHKLALACFMKDSLKRLMSRSFPKGIISNIHSWYERAIHDFDRQPDSYYDTLKLNFKIDFGVCCLKSLPIGGAWFVKIRMIRPQVFFTLDIHRLKRIWRCVLFKTKGFFPYVVIHTVPRYMLRFNCQRMNLGYKQIGELMKYNTRIKGIFRRSWFLDPNLKNVSPALTYLREIPERNGAILFEGGTTRHEITESLEFSPRRRKLYEEGKYIPAAYAYIWPRKEFLEWLRQNHVEPSESFRH
jgi:hypothetical protein